jgi:hypothetical protein
MTDRRPIRVLVDGVHKYPNAKSILVKLGVTTSARRMAVRDQLRRVGRAEVVFRGRTYVIEAIL